MSQRFLFFVVIALHLDLCALQLRGVNALREAIRARDLIDETKPSELFLNIKILQAANKNPLPRIKPLETCQNPADPKLDSDRVLVQCSEEVTKVCLDVDRQEPFLETNLRQLVRGSEFNLDDIQCEILN